jgi:hypothetical protein
MMTRGIVTIRGCIGIFSDFFAEGKCGILAAGESAAVFSDKMGQNRRIGSDIGLPPVGEPS